MTQLSTSLQEAQNEEKKLNDQVTTLKNAIKEAKHEKSQQLKKLNAKRHGYSDNEQQDSDVNDADPAPRSRMSTRSGKTYKG